MKPVIKFHGKYLVAHHMVARISNGKSRLFTKLVAIQNTSCLFQQQQKTQKKQDSFWLVQDFMNIQNFELVKLSGEQQLQ